MMLNILKEKPYYSICEKGTKIPANLGGLDRIEYRSNQDLIRQLKKKVLPNISKKYTGEHLTREPRGQLHFRSEEHLKP